MRKICVVTGTRAEYGLLSRLMRMIKESQETQLQVIVTNMHLSPKYGNTYREIEKDDFIIDYKIPIIDDNSKDDSLTTIKSMAKALAGFSEAYNELNPDMIIVLGDRYEILAATEAALITRIPVAHIGGGEITEGAFDDSIRHSITKMSHLHFTSTDVYRNRVIQLGEQPERVFFVGAPGVENIKKMPLMEKKVIEEEIDFKIDEKTILVTYHPVTLGNRIAKDDIDDFIAAMEERKDLRIIFTMPNSDTGSHFIVAAINDFVKKNANRAKSFKSLGVVRYLSVMQQVAAVVGNSSSGIVEVPSFRIPTLNIGDRQKGRIQAESICNCLPDKDSILQGLDVTLSKEFRALALKAHNPYEKANTAEQIFKVICTYPLEQLNQKHFYDIPQ